MKFSVYIPARFGAIRLPGKLLLPLDGSPVIRHTCQQALASGATSIVLATDDARIAAAIADLDVRICMTGSHHQSGTDRIAEAVLGNNEPDDAVIVNLQGDEALMPVAVIDQVASALTDDPAAAVATVCERFAEEADITDPNIVKVVRDHRNRALYFSRAPIPWDRDRFNAGALTDRLPDYRRHIGIYAYRAAYLRAFIARPPAPLEQIERLEQLRALYYGDVITVPDAVAAVGIGIDTAADLERARRRFAP